MDDILLISATSLVVICAVEFLKCILEYVFRESEKEKRVVIIPVKNDVDKLQTILGELKSKYDIYILDLGLCSDKKCILQAFCKENSFVKICYPDSLEEILSKNYCLQLADKYSII